MPSKTAVTIITQTRTRPGQDDAFVRWQRQVSEVVAGYPGFIDQELIAPTPPAQVDWVILQRFEQSAAALDWLRSADRERLVAAAQPLLIGHDDVHIVESGAERRPAPVSVVISTRVTAGQEQAYRAWEQRIAAAQARAPGFQGYKFEPPITGVQDDWVAILRFDSEANLDGWLTSPERLALLAEADAFTEEVHARTIRTGFDQWFGAGSATAPAPSAWKQNMLVLLALYPVVFLFGEWVGTPLLTERWELPFWLALFISNIASVLILNRLVPWVSGRMNWWLAPAEPDRSRLNLIGAAVVVALYVLLLLAFSQYP